ncbi:uncharacterized protein LOC116303680 [Actinia tenebrosa]|uniref:Uncharacterized protein LOC116303680 n=1 Tax=Actinia tenebrosa TaxID=6105 RepID=A0A6P8IPX9_ACTTE|nr:uncharacterized protein LOC116303680 [Actinia tenebrosa]
MDKEKYFSVQPNSRNAPYLRTRSRESGRTKTTFRKTARQIWIANSISKHHVGVESYSKSSEGNQKTLNSTTLETNASSPSRPPSVQRRGTPDIFPMSSEMRKTLVLLGNLDLLPEEERKRQDELVQAEKNKKLKSFRQRAQMRVIQPQRFIRSFRNGGIRKNAEKNANELENINTTAVESLINSRASNDTSSLCAKAEEMEKNNDEIKLENISSDDEDDGSERQKTKRDSLFFTPSPREQERSSKDPWRKAIKRHQHVQVVPNPSNPFFVRKRFNQTKREFFSKSWQPNSNFHEKFPSIKRTYSLGSPRTLSTEPTDLNIDLDDYTEPINDGKTIDEITNDIQERCSKWFEFRQKILTKSYEHK